MELKDHTGTKYNVLQWKHIRNSVINHNQVKGSQKETLFDNLARLARLKGIWKKTRNPFLGGKNLNKIGTE